MVNICYQKHKERFRKEARARYQNLSEEEKDKRLQKVQDRYPNLPEDQKQKYMKNMNIYIYEIYKYMKKYYLAHKK